MVNSITKGEGSTHLVIARTEQSEGRSNLYDKHKDCFARRRSLAMTMMYLILRRRSLAMTMMYLILRWRLFAMTMVCLLLFCPPSIAAQEWKELKRDHFIVYYTAKESFPRKVSYNAEKYYDRIADELGYARYSNFWQWENRVKIYIYPDQGSFIASGPYPAWSHGIANYENKSIYTYEGSEGFLYSILPHEITHLIFRDYVGGDNQNIPLWLDEGVAQWSEPKKKQIIKSAVKYINENDALLSLKKFMQINIMAEKNNDMVRDYYIQAMSLVDFLVGRYGPEKFIYFCRSLRDGKNINEALKYAYPVSIRSIDDLEKEWRKYIENI